MFAKLLPNRSTGFFDSMITLSTCYWASFIIFFVLLIHLKRNTMPGFFEFPNPIIEKDSHISFSKIGELILRFELQNHSLYKNFPALVFRIRVTRLLWLMLYFLLLAFHLKIGNSFFVFTNRTPFTSQTKWQMSYNFLYCENVEKLLPNRSIGFFTSMITLSTCYWASFKIFFFYY